MISKEKLNSDYAETSFASSWTNKICCQSPKSEGFLVQLDTLLVITALHFSLRMPLIQYVPRGVDAQFHLLAASKFRKGRPPKVLDKFIVGDNYTQPPLLHALLSLFREKLRPRMLLVFGAISDYGTTLLTYSVALQYLPEPYAFVAAILHCITPASYLESISESPRSLGALWYNLSILLLVRQGPMEMVLASITIALTLLSHKMAAQTLLFTCLLISPILYNANNLFPLTMLAGLCLALLVTKGGYVRTLRDHVRTLGFFLRYGRGEKRRKKLRDPKWLVKLQPFFYIPFFGLLSYPQLLLVETSLFLAWFVSVLLVFFIWWLGDDYRYLAFSAVPTAVLSSYAIYIGVNFFVLIPSLAVSFAVIGKNLWTFHRKKPVLPDFTKIDLPSDSITLVMPSWISYVSARNLNGKLLCGGGNAEALRFELETMPEMMSTSPEKLVQEYHVTHVLLGPQQRDFIKPIEDRFEQVLKTNGYVLFKRK